MPIPEITYSEFREKAENFNSKAKPYSFCKAINGGCCHRDVDVIKDDKEFIRDAIQRGDIPRETVRRAQRRARDPQEKQCPFLGEQGECTIYPYRPLICIQHGNGGLPRDPGKRKEVLGGSQEEIPIKDIVPYSCESCAPHIDATGTVPAEVVRRSLLVLFVSRSSKSRTSLNTFVAKELPRY